MGNKVKPLANLIYRPIAWFSNSNVAKNAGKQVYNNNRRYIDLLGVSSIVAKDGLGCVLYVNQSMHNKEIPDDKRNFVTALDLTNGLLMIAFQLGMFFTVQNKVCQSKMFNAAFGKLFNRPLKKAYQSIVKNSSQFKDINDIKFSQKFEKIRSDVKDAFGGLISLVAASIIGKRVIVPFIATPLADGVERKLNERSARKKGLPLPENTKGATPSMQGSQVVVMPARTQKVDAQDWLNN